jgi:hypothetical protein
MRKGKIMGQQVSSMELSGKKRFSNAFYNSMPGVEKADSEIAQGALLLKAIEILRPLYRIHDTIDYCGINLLHRHWNVAPNEVPEQTRLELADEAKLITRPVKASDAQSSYAASWSFFRGKDAIEFVPLEFTTDSLAHECVKELSNKQRFLEDVGDALVRHDLYRHFGVCAPLRESLSDKPNAELIEITETERRSVIEARVLTPEERKNTIRTVWMFDHMEGNDTNCVTGTRCISGCKPSSCLGVIRFPDGPNEHEPIPHDSYHRFEEDKTDH